jgi:hypothetical protein
VSFQTACQAVPTHQVDHAWGQSGLFSALANNGRSGAFTLLDSAAWEPTAMRLLSLLDDEEAPVAVEDCGECPDLSLHGH